MSGSRGLDAKFMQELKTRNDIIEVIGSYVSLDKKGGNHWACCPFHHERTASFAVNESDQFYHCFGCGVSGDVVKFVQEIESTDFMGAVRILAARAKMEVPELSGAGAEEAAKAKKKRDALAAIMLDTAKFYRANLYSGDRRADEHLQYISNRNLAPTTVKRFGLGASLDFSSLPEYLLKKGYSKEDVLDSGVVTEGKNGRLVDFQAKRLIFPIINAFDEVIAFGGRSLEKTDFAKYKNTKETILFNKSKTLYNINLLKKLKKTQAIKEIIIVEGYMDTISLYQAGFQNVVASMGTALTKEQSRLMKRYSENILISYDGDFAGQKNTVRGLEILASENLQVRVVPLPEGLDPDDVVKQGAEAYQKCLDAAMPLVDFKIHYLERKFDLNKTEEKRAFIAAALKVVGAENSASVREDLLKKLSKKTGISFGALERDLNNLEKEPKQDETPVVGTVSETVAGSDKHVKASRFILAAKLMDMPYARDFPIESLSFSSSEHRLIADYIAEKEESRERARPSDLFEILDENSAEVSAIFDLNYGDRLSGETAERFFSDSVKVLKRENIERQIAVCSNEYEVETDEKKRKELAERLQELMRMKRKLR